MPLQSSGEDAVARADVVIGFVVRRDDLGMVEPVLAAARADRLAWIAYPKGGQLGTDLKPRQSREERLRTRGAASVPGVD
jgi:hypothetical protein